MGNPNAPQTFEGNITDYSGRKSRYLPNAAPSLSTSTIVAKGVIKGSDGSGSARDINEIRERLTRDRGLTETELNKLETKINEEQAKYQACVTELLYINNQHKELSNVLNLPQVLQRKMNQHQQQITTLERKMSIDSQHQKEALQKQFKSNVTKTIALSTELATLLSNYFQKITHKRVHNSSRNLYARQIQDLESSLQRSKREIENITMAIRALQDRQNNIQNDINDVTEQMTEIIQSYGGYDAFVRDIFPKVIEECPETTKDTILDRIAELEAQIKAIVDNPQLVERHQRLTHDLETARHDLAEAENSFINAEASLQQRSQQWLNRVRTIRTKLSNLFSIYMSGLGFKGDIELRETGRFVDYELQLRVAFHQGSPLADLSGTRHSGGERAVSTVMFLMALQHMGTAPFRVVDEINQGMDERNERLVVDRIVKVCCDDQSAGQYFLVTPKLLQGLRCFDHPDVTVLLIWNGPGIGQKWNLPELLRNLLRKRGIFDMADTGSKKRVLNQVNEGDEEEEGDGNESSGEEEVAVQRVKTEADGHRTKISRR
jgi:chromosome segregation ATPase